MLPYVLETLWPRLLLGFLVLVLLPLGEFIVGGPRGGYLVAEVPHSPLRTSSNTFLLTFAAVAVHSSVNILRKRENSLSTAAFVCGAAELAAAAFLHLGLLGNHLNCRGRIDFLLCN